MPVLGSLCASQLNCLWVGEMGVSGGSQKNTHTPGGTVLCASAVGWALTHPASHRQLATFPNIAHQFNP